MKKILILIMLGFFNKLNADNNKLAYNYQFNSIDGKIIKLVDYKDKVIVVVNVASRCGYTPQYNGLQKIWDEYKDKNLVVIDSTNNFKQEPGSNKEIKDFCETNFGVNFPMTEKVDVIGNKAHLFINGQRNLRYRCYT